MKKLIDFVTIIRSKNAGPLYLTLDLIFNDENAMNEVLDSNVLSKETVAKLYECKAEDVSIIPYKVVNAIKITLPRKYISGSVVDTDIYGCQQHMPLANLEVL